jgi:subtilisin family serine protease
MHRHVLRVILFTGTIAVAACVDDAPLAPTPQSITASSVQLAATQNERKGGRYLVVFKPGRSAARAVEDEIRTGGGRLEGEHDEAGFAVVSEVSLDAVARLARSSDVSSVEPDVEFSIEPMTGAEAIEAGAIGTQSAAAPQTAALFRRQWNMRAIAADAAWAGGFLGSPTVRVAILDTGIDYRWPDLDGRVDLSRSISLRPDEDARLADAIAAGWFGPTNLQLHPITDLNAHGTLVASIVASNAIVFAGVTSQTTLFGVKVCIVFNTCSTAAVLNGIVYAVDHGADVINMSLGGTFLKSGNQGFVAVINSVFNYANRHGTVIVVAAGNAAANMDANRAVYFAYCDSPHVLCVSATGPAAAAGANGPFTDVDTFAPYSNYGRSISVAAPGGGVTSVGTLVSGPCSQTSLFWHQPPRPSPGAPLPPPVIDGPLCPSSVGLFLVRGNGTSFSSPHVAGVAASVIAAQGHSQAAEVRKLVERTSDDLGARGKDPFYGRGRVNAARALAGMEGEQVAEGRRVIP